MLPMKKAIDKATGQKPVWRGGWVSPLSLVWR
jgi:hypothetical protein